MSAGSPTNGGVIGSTNISSNNTNSSNTNNTNTNTNTNNHTTSLSYTISNTISLSHIKQIIIRNIVVTKPIDCYITIHDVHLKPIYRSNVIKNTINPTFIVDFNNIANYSNNINNSNTSRSFKDLSSKKFVLRLWYVDKKNDLAEAELFDILNHKSRDLSTVPTNIDHSNMDMNDHNEYNKSIYIMNDIYRNSLNHPHMPCLPCNSMPIITPIPNSLKAAKLVNLYDKNLITNPCIDKCIYEMSIDLQSLNISPPSNLNELIDIGPNSVVFVYNDGRMSFLQLSSTPEGLTNRDNEPAILRVISSPLVSPKTSSKSNASIKSADLPTMLNYMWRLSEYSKHFNSSKANMDGIESLVENAVSDFHQNTTLDRDIHIKKMKIKALKANIENAKAQIKNDRAKLSEQRLKLIPKVKAILTQKAALDLQVARYTDAESWHLQLVTTDGLVQKKLNARRRRLIATLSHSIYPLAVSRTGNKSALVNSRDITQVGSGSSVFYVGANSLPSALLSNVIGGSIRGIRLPYPIVSNPVLDNEVISTVLGYLAHFIQLLAKYFDVTLRFKVVPQGSTSYIKDDSSSTVPYSFPLYIDGVDREKFDCGFVLLNKNIEQILNSRNIAYNKPINYHNIIDNLSLLIEAEIP